MMENERAREILDLEINARYDTEGKIPKPMDFVVGSGSCIHTSSSGDYREVHVEGYFPFSEDLRLFVTADGEWDCKETKDKREKRIWGVADYNAFRGYSLSAVLQTDEDVYVEALKRLEFPWEQEFEDGKMIIEGYYLPYEMFAQIRLLGLVGDVQEFVDLAMDKELEKTQKELESKVAYLGLDEYPVECYARYQFVPDFRGGGYDAVPVAMAQYADPDTGVGFEVGYFPAAESDAKRKTTFWVTIPENVPQWVKDLFNEKWGIPSIDGLDIVDSTYFEDRVYSEEINFLVTKDGRVNYFSWDERTFLEYFKRWERALYVLKYGKPERLESDVFGSGR